MSEVDRKELVRALVYYRSLVYELRKLVNTAFKSNSIETLEDTMINLGDWLTAERIYKAAETEIEQLRESYNTH